MSGTAGRDGAHWRGHYADSAAAWTKWAEPLAEQQDKVNALLLDAAGVGAGMSVLDLASGAGEPAIGCAARVGPQGRVQATDAVAAMVDGLRERIARRGLTNVDCTVAPMERLPFGDTSFDAVTSRYGLMYVDDPVAALAEARRVLRPGGRIALMVWGPEEENTLVWPVFRAVQSVAPELMTEDQVVRPLRFAAADSLAPLLREAGFDDAAERDVVLRPKLRRGVPYWMPLIEMNAGRVWAALDAARRAEVERRLLERIERWADGDAYRFTTHVRIATGTRG